MYTRKNKDLIGSIKNNKNNKAYFALIITMLAAICIIAACVILNIKPTMDQNETSQNTIEATTVEVTVDSQTTEQTTKVAVNMTTRLYVCLKERVVIAANYDDLNAVGEVLAVINCNISEDLKNQLTNTIVKLPESDSKSDKSLWKKLKINNEGVYVQYYSKINGIVFSSALYEESNNPGSLVVDSYNSIISEDYDNTINNNGIMMTTNGARWIFENIPGSTPIFVCQDIKSANLTVLEPYENYLYLNEHVIDAAYYRNGQLMSIPDMFYYDPTDEAAVAVYYAGTLDKIKNIKEVVAEAGEVSYSIFEPNCEEIRNLFADVKLYNDAGEDISSYLNIYIDLSGYTEQQIAYYNNNGLLWPGRYKVNIVAADMHGNTVTASNYISLVDTTGPVIQMKYQVNDMNEEQHNNRQYILGLVTVTELCKLDNWGLQYILDERDGYYCIHYFAYDYFGNHGSLDVQFKKVD